MSDGEEVPQQEVAQVEEEEKVDNINIAIKSVIKKSNAHGGLVKGLNEVGKALDRKTAVLCVLAADCHDPKYKKLITALAKQSAVPLIEVDSRDEVGEWLGLCKYDVEGNPRKVRGTSSVAILDFGEESEALSFVLNHVKQNK